MSTTDQAAPYQQGHHSSITANHATRTATSDAAFLLPYLLPHFKILDLGCGPGTITTGFASFVPQGSVVGVDISPQVIEQAENFASRLEGGKPANVRFAVGDVLKGLDFEDETFDAVWMSQVSVHIPDPVKAYSEIKRVLKHGGIFADREGDFPFRWQPYLPGLQLMNKYLYEMVITRKTTNDKNPDNAPHGEGHRSGSMVHVWAREAGFDPSKMEKRGRVTMYGKSEERERYAGYMTARIEEGGHRQKYRELGASEEEVDAMVRDLQKWKDDVDGVHYIVQVEVIGRK